MKLPRLGWGCPNTWIRRLNAATKRELARQIKRELARKIRSSPSEAACDRSRLVAEVTLACTKTFGESGFTASPGYCHDQGSRRPQPTCLRSTSSKDLRCRGRP